MSRLCSNHSRSYPGRSAPCPGKWRATEIDCGEEESSLSPEQKSAEVIVAVGLFRGRPRRTEQGGQGGGMTTSTKPGPYWATAPRRRVIDPALSETCLTFHPA